MPTVHTNCQQPDLTVKKNFFMLNSNEHENDPAYKC